MNTAWTELKLSWELHSRPPEKLAAPERERLQGTLKRQVQLESLILASEEAMCAIIPPGAVEERLAAIHLRYPSKSEMLADLKRLGMSEASLGVELTRDLVIENTLERINSRIPQASETDAEIFYHLNPKRFLQPEIRLVRHILVTFNDAAESRSAYALLAQLRARITDEKAFADAALRHSHCPSALEGGRLGWVKRGQLYTEIDQAVFSLTAGELTQVLHSEVGWHLARCDEITAEKQVAFTECRQAIVDHLNAERCKRGLQQWLAGQEKLRAA